MDVVFICGIPFLLSISKKICVILITHLRDRRTETLKAAIDKQYAAYSSNGFKIAVILSDGEGAVLKLSDHIRSKGTELNVTVRNEHVPEVERANRVLKERDRCY